MKKVIVAVSALSIAFLMTASINLAGGKKVKKFKATCPVSGKPIDKSVSVDHNGGKVYMCCPKCPAAFKAKTDKFAAKANLQLVGTGQAKLVKCMFTGRPLNPETKINVGGVDCCFCCFNCQGKAKKLKGAAQVNAIFNEKAFKKGFKVAPPK